MFSPADQSDHPGFEMPRLSAIRSREWPARIEDTYAAIAIATSSLVLVPGLHEPLAVECRSVVKCVVD
jgi:hypothetical protein